MINLIFKTQAATTEEQSMQLLALGLRPETADCYIGEDGHPVIARDEDDLYIALNIRHLPPAWSLNRLIVLMPMFLDKKNFPKEYSVIHIHIGPSSIGYIAYKRGKETEFIRNYDHVEMYENVISMIAWLIANRHFNKEYITWK